MRENLFLITIHIVKRIIKNIYQLGLLEQDLTDGRIFGLNAFGGYGELKPTSTRGNSGGSVESG